MAYARSERHRGFQPPYYTVNIYTCDNPECAAETRLRVPRGGLGRGAVMCGECDWTIPFDGSEGRPTKEETSARN